MSDSQPARAITIWQPYATLIAIGAKQFETRSWSTYHTGPLLIHAARRWDADRADDCERVKQVLEHHDFTSDATIGHLPWKETLGCVLAVATLVVCTKCRWMSRGLTDMEREYGNFAPYRLAWQLADVQPLKSPVACRGHQGLWIPDKELLELVAKEIGKGES